MKRMVAVPLVGAGALFFLLGLLFFVGAGGVASRYVLAGIGLVSGAVLIGFGVRLFKQAEAASPEQVLADILELAQRRNGEVAEVEVGAALGRRAAIAPEVFGRLLAARLCDRQVKEGGTFYVFKGLQPRLFVRKCPYCGAEFSIASAATRCPTCGGPIETRAEGQALEGGEYRMDE